MICSVLLGTAAPFLVGLVAAWATPVVRAAADRVAGRAVVLAGTAVIGLLLRAGFTGRLPLTFAVIASVSLGGAAAGLAGAVARGRAPGRPARALSGRPAHRRRRRPTTGRMPARTLLTPGTVAPMRPVPAHIPRPEYVGKPAPARSTEPWVQTARGHRGDAGGRPDRRRRRWPPAARPSRPGVTTDEVDRVVHEYLVDHDAYPSTLGYKGFPKSCCTSLNEVICHGIPDSTVIQDGDIVNIDVTAFIGGVHGDTNATFLAGDVAEEDRLLVERTREATMRAIKAVRPGRELNVVGRVIESYAKRFGYGVVRDFTGHGIGRSFHSGLVVLHYDEPERAHRAGDRDDLHHRADDHPRRRRLRHLGRRLDGGHQGPAAHRAVRAHHAGHRGRRGDPHPALTGR